MRRPDKIGIRKKMGKVILIKVTITDMQELIKFLPSQVKKHNSS